MKKDKPNLNVVSVEELHPDQKPQIISLLDRLHEVVHEYADQESKNGRIVTRAEIVGTIEFLKKRCMD